MSQKQQLRLPDQFFIGTPHHGDDYGLDDWFTVHAIPKEGVDNKNGVQDEPCIEPSAPDLTPPSKHTSTIQELSVDLEMLRKDLERMLRKDLEPADPQKGRGLVQHLWQRERDARDSAIRREESSAQASEEAMLAREKADVERERGARESGLRDERARWHTRKYAYLTPLSMLLIVFLAMLLPTLLVSQQRTEADFVHPVDEVHPASFDVEAEESSLPERPPASPPSGSVLAPSSLEPAQVEVEESSLPWAADTERTPAGASARSVLAPSPLEPALAPVDMETTGLQELPKVKPELRQARDGKWYTWDAFLTYYGPSKARTMWNDANKEGWRRNVDAQIMGLKPVAAKLTTKVLTAVAAWARTF